MHSGNNLIEFNGNSINNTCISNRMINYNLNFGTGINGVGLNGSNCGGRFNGVGLNGSNCGSNFGNNFNPNCGSNSNPNVNHNINNLTFNNVTVLPPCTTPFPYLGGSYAHINLPTIYDYHRLNSGRSNCLPHMRFNPFINNYPYFNPGKVNKFSIYDPLLTHHGRLNVGKVNFIY